MLHPLEPAPGLKAIGAPKRFTYPFHYVPHPLAIAAAEDLQRHLRTQTDWAYDFGHDDHAPTGGKGKMFGVLVVRAQDGELGYLAAHSGKLAGSNQLPGFVPPVFDLLTEGGFYRAGEKELWRKHGEIEALEADPALAAAKAELGRIKAAAATELDARKATRRAAKQDRKARRAAAGHLPPAEYATLERELARESTTQHFIVKDQTRIWNERTANAQAAVDVLQGRIDALKQARADYSNALQKRIFEHYRFLDATGERRDLLAIFRRTPHGTPPAGAGECAAPKLLQYAYGNHFQPVALAEFWWGRARPPRSAATVGTIRPAGANASRSWATCCGGWTWTRTRSKTPWTPNSTSSTKTST